MEIFAHRGASSDYPENTILAFKKALTLPINGIELDVHKSKDGELVVIHDEDIQRTFKGRGMVEDYSLLELQSFNCRKFEFVNNELCKVPTLEDVLILIKDKNITLNIEAKTDQIHYDLENDVLELVEKYNMKNNVLISSFNHKCLNIFKSIDSSYKYGALYEAEKDFASENNVVEHAKKLGVYSINISKELVTKEMVDLAHSNNLKVYVYTVNAPIIMRKMIEFDVDAVFTDYPELMLEVLSEKEYCV
ncbi:glycerophosphodiester phosphodiesterase [Romboutsia weinsteinii]|uniref:Glycerophosphodiester phosphodiesterase n=1 Tax=Romboutsia weinsteinii TaxID=2020949 RepID=A0A371IY69_9FIRM|nr:glycerophosphodiester phosphodiesterase [Romboutsia weinsteinii]RDY25445.1 glycerophosphodiester phosphodiesterase [Romboutsia weinsteinii]